MKMVNNTYNIQINTLAASSVLGGDDDSWAVRPEIISRKIDPLKFVINAVENDAKYGQKQQQSYN